MKEVKLLEAIERLTLERDALLHALEVIAVGDSKNPVLDAGDELVALGFWRAEAVAAIRATAPSPLPSEGEMRKEMEE